MKHATSAITPAAVRPTLMVSALACTDHAVEDDCRYQVAWQINPHMEVGAVDFSDAAREHAAFVDALGRAGARVEILPFVHGAFDSVFAKDSALLLERRGARRALLARLRYPERQREQAARADYYERHQFEVVCESTGPSWEGGDIVMSPTGQRMFLGYGPRTGLSAASWLERNAGIPVHPLELCDPHLYHLDMALAILPDGSALACIEAFTAEAVHALERAPGIRQVIPVPREDALAFGLNLVPIGPTIVCGSRVPRIVPILRARGYDVSVAELGQFHFAGGSAACLVAKVHPDPEPAREVKSALPRTAMDIYGSLFRSVLFPLWETGIRRRPIVERWQELRRTQWLPLEELRAMQDAAVARLVDHAYAHVPFYRRRFEQAGLTAKDVRTAHDLLKLPILRREDLRIAGKDRESTAPPFCEVRKQTSGTTGEPLLFGYERDSDNWRRAVKLRGYEWAGYRPGDRALHFWGAPLPSAQPAKARAKIAIDRYLNRDTHIPCAVMTDDHLHETVRAIERISPKVIVCYAQAGAELARFIQRNGLRTWETIPVITGAEKLLPRDRADLEDAFGPAVFDTYGCREVMMIAGECEAHHGLHTSMENVVVEIIVDDNGVRRPAREGETGEVVFTDLHNFAMPFIRYANGDIATAGPSRKCSCGRTLPRIMSIQGRMSETLRDGNGAPVSGIALSFLFHDVAGAIRQFQAVQHRDRSVSINIVLVEPLSPTVLEGIRAHGSRLLTGIDVKVNVVPELQRSPAGKHNLVVVER